ncbi:MAG: hypothetical protein ABF633_03515 [Clostridium sp.]|uniref:hypothetical protein n=1 Tax=Clostridium sp. TaxID=1506 RepID=UPI0039EC137A
MTNLNKEMVNNLAHKLSNEVLSDTEKQFAYTDLVNELLPLVPKLTDYFIRNNDISDLKINEDDYNSRIVFEGVTHSIKGYNKAMGDFTARFKFFSIAWLKSQRNLDMAKKTLATLKADNYDLLFESEKINPTCELDDSVDEIPDTLTVIEEFIATDKEGQVIAILIDVQGQKERNEAFARLFGKYTATERKKVQRAKQRLQAHLQKIGVCI